MATTTTKKATKELITAPVVNRIACKETRNCLGYLVKSNSSEQYYQITWNRSTHQYQCNCKATVKCCHIKAVEQVLEAKKELARERNIGNFFEALATFAQDEIARQAVQEAEQIAAEVEEKQIEVRPAPASQPPTSVAVVTKPVAVTTKPIISKSNAPLRGSVGIGFPQRKDTPAPRRVAVPMR